MERMTVGEAGPEKIIIVATEADGRRARGRAAIAWPERRRPSRRRRIARWITEHLPTAANRHSRAVAAVRARVAARLDIKEPRRISAAEQARLRAAYDADYERWLGAQGFPTNFKHTPSSGPATLLPSEE